MIGGALVLVGAGLALWPTDRPAARLRALTATGRIGSGRASGSGRISGSGGTSGPYGASGPYSASGSRYVRWSAAWTLCWTSLSDALVRLGWSESSLAAGRGRSPVRAPRQRTSAMPGSATVAVLVGAAVGVALGGVVAGGAVSGVSGPAAGLPLGFASGVVTGTAALLGAAWADRRRRIASDRDLDTAVSLLASELDAGAAPEVAWAAAAASSVLVPADPADLVRRSDPSPAGLFSAVTRPDPSPAALHPVAITWQAAASTGAPLARLMGRVRADLLDGRGTRREVEAALAGPRASAGLLAVLPLLGIGLGAAMGAHPASVLLGTGLGRWLLCLGVLLDALGVLWTEALVRRAWPR